MRRRKLGRSSMSLSLWLKVSEALSIRPEWKTILLRGDLRQSDFSREYLKPPISWVEAKLCGRVERSEWFHWNQKGLLQILSGKFLLTFLLKICRIPSSNVPLPICNFCVSVTMWHVTFVRYMWHLWHIWCVCVNQLHILLTRKCRTTLLFMHRRNLNVNCHCHILQPGKEQNFGQ